MSERPWWSHVLQWALWFAAMLAVMGWLNRMRSRPRPPGEAGRLVHPVSTLIVGVVITAFFLGIAIASNVWANGTETWWTTTAFLGFGAMGGAMVAEYFRARHSVSDLGLNYRGLLRPGGFIPWDTVATVRYAPTMKWFRIESRDGQIARISVMLMGLPEFAQALLAHVPASAIDGPARPILEATAAGSPPSVWV
jgi:hypothetical protein